MAACNFWGISSVQLSKLEFKLCQSYGITCAPERRNVIPFTTLRNSANSLPITCAPSPVPAPAQIQTATNLEDELEGENVSAIERQIIPNAFEVESLLSEICDASSIAEFELKFGGFRLYVTRDLVGKNKHSPPASPPVITNTAVQTPDSNGSVSSYSLAISKPAPLGETRTLREKATDEGLVIVNSPRVGYFRRSRTIKGKRAPPPCKENQLVKEGQVLCYIEQLGGEIPIESDVAGEVVKILRKDGDAVGYGDALMEILPSFPGIKKLQ